MTNFKTALRENDEETIESLYLDYVNNFLTVGRFAEYYGEELLTAHNLIESGRLINHARAAA